MSDTDAMKTAKITKIIDSPAEASNSVAPRKLSSFSITSLLSESKTDVDGTKIDEKVAKPTPIDPSHNFGSLLSTFGAFTNPFWYPWMSLYQDSINSSAAASANGSAANFLERRNGE